MNTKGLFYGFVFGLILLLALARNGVADAPVPGPITSDTTWTLAGSPYIVTESVLVMEGITLTIEPGVVVKFDGKKALRIDGELIARGAKSNMITFTSKQSPSAPGDWDYIFFTDTSVDAVFDDNNNNYVSGSILEYCKVEFGGRMLPSSGTIRIEASSPFINYCLIENNDSSGIHITNGAPKISYNIINGNSAQNGGGIFATSSGKARITNNTITNNSASGGGGIFASGISIIIDKNIVKNNSATGGAGIYVVNSIVTNNIIANNSIGYGKGAGIYAGNGSAEVDGNIITNNSATNGSAGIYASAGNTVTNNSIIGNSITEPSIVVFADAAGAFLLKANFNYNTVSNNIVPKDTDTGGVSIGSTSSLNYNNIHSNSGLYLYNNNLQGSPNLNAENNCWGTAIESEIQDKIYDWFDDASLGIVDYSPYPSTPNTTAPISPPTGFTATESTGGIILEWSVNTESDTAGYRVHWGTTSDFPYANVVDVGIVTSYTITGIDPGTYYITITAYDIDYNTANDNSATIVNENQTNGNESWYASENKIEFGGDFSANTTSGKNPLVVNFTDESTGDINAWLWDFGDGGTSTERNPVYTYNHAGTYTVSLIVTVSGTKYTKIKKGYITVNPTTVSGGVSTSIAGHSDLAVINTTVYIEGTTYTTITDDNGNFTFENVPAGIYTVIVTAPNLVPLSQQITVPAGQDKIIDLPTMMVLTQEELEQAVVDERQRWDINGDNKITLEEAIHALQVVSGVRPK